MVSPNLVKSAAAGAFVWVCFVLLFGGMLVPLYHGQGAEETWPLILGGASTISIAFAVGIFWLSSRDPHFWD